MSVDAWFRGARPIEERSTVVICFGCILYQMFIECIFLLQETDALGLREV